MEVERGEHLVPAWANIGEEERRGRNERMIGGREERKA